MTMAGLGKGTGLSGLFVATFVTAYMLVGVVSTKVYTWLFITARWRVCEMPAVMALTVEFMRMLAMALFITGTAMAVRIVATSNTVRSSGRLKPWDLFCV